MTSSSSKPPHPYSRFIPREELQGFTAWKPGSFGAAPPDAAAAASDDAAVLARLAAARAAALQEGYQAGYRDGTAALEKFKQGLRAESATRVAQLLESVDGAFAALEPRLAQAVADCACALARQVLKAELAQRPPLVAQVAAQAAQSLVLSARHVIVRAHPDDAALIAEGAAETLAARGARVQADPAIERGGCVVDSDVGAIDARIAQRWQQACANLGTAVAWGDEPAGGPGA